MSSDFQSVEESRKRIAEESRKGVEVAMRYAQKKTIERNILKCGKPKDEECRFSYEDRDAGQCERCDI